MDLRAICFASPEFVDVNYVSGPPFFAMTTLVFQDYIVWSPVLWMHTLFFDVPLFVGR